MAQIYFVKHPSKEPKYGTTNVGDRIRVLWTTGEHKRKFIKHDGEFLTNDGVVDFAPLYFWGEYEPYSCAHIMQKKKTIAIHDDLKSVRDISTTINPICLYPQQKHNGLNTDPYIFGDRFRYICCMKQQIENCAKFQPGDVVIFGNVIGTYFYFDTVFVYKEECSSKDDEQYYHACMEPAHREHYALGYMYQDKYIPNGYQIFSFVPCFPNSFHETDDLTIAQSFTSPKLKCRDFNIPIGKCGARINPCFCPKELNQNMWEKILKAVSDANLFIGIHFAEI